MSLTTRPRTKPPIKNHSYQFYATKYGLTYVVVKNAHQRRFIDLADKQALFKDLMMTRGGKAPNLTKLLSLCNGATDEPVEAADDPPETAKPELTAAQAIKRLRHLGKINKALGKFTDADLFSELVLRSNLK